MVKVFVGRVPSALGTDRLREMFEKYGTVTECQTVKDYAFVHMDSESAAENAIKAYHNLSIEGGTLTVEKSHGRPAKSKMPERNGGSVSNSGGRGGPSGGRRDFGGRDNGYERRDSGRGSGYRERSPIDRRRDDYGRGDDRGYASRGGGYGTTDPASSYGDRGYGSRAPPSGGYDSRAPAPSSYGYNDPYARRPSPPRYSGGYGGSSAGGSYGASSGYGSAPASSGYGGSSSYDNYDRYGAGRGYSSAAPAAGVTRRY